MKKTADKKDDGKIKVELVPPEFILEVGKVLTFGAAKYGANNWRKGLPWTRTLGATFRHLYAWSMGEDKDKESGLSHLAHAVTNLCFLITWSKTHSDMDDRIKQ